MHPWPILLIPLVVIVSIMVVLTSRVIEVACKLPKSKRIMTFPRALLAVSVALAVAMAIDYRAFQAREQKVSEVVSSLGGELGHISTGWPGTRYTAFFERPLTDEELEELAALKLLTGRNGVEISFRCEMTPSQLEAVQKAFPECRVITLPH